MTMMTYTSQDMNVEIELGGASPEQIEAARQARAARSEAAEIDLLDEIPVESPNAGQPSHAQAQLMAKLTNELLDLDRGAWEQAVDYTKRMSGHWTPGREGNASRWIDRLIAKLTTLRNERRSGMYAGVTEDKELEDGVYLLDGDYYMVQHAVHGSGKQYAKLLVLPEDPELDKVRGIYAPGVIRQLTPAHLVTGEQAAAFGQVYGQCVFCLRPLTDDRSKEVGYGETCAEHRGLPWG